MRKVIAAMNCTVDGFCDHTSMNADAEIHDHYTNLLNSADTLIYGKTTYLMMEDYWPTLITKPSGEKSMDDFAKSIDKISKIVFSHSLKQLHWDTARLATKSLKEEIEALKQQSGGDILLGSPSMIVQTLKLNLIDELQLAVHPVIAGSGLQLLKDIQQRSDLKLLKTKTFGCGAILPYYQVK